MKQKQWLTVLSIILFITTTSWAMADAPVAEPGIYTGVFLEPGQTMASFEKMTGKKMAMTMGFSNWSQRSDLPIAMIKSYAKLGKIYVVAWEPMTDLNSIIQGKYDDFLRKNAGLIAALKIRVMIRFAHEMNGSWYDWDGKHNGGGETDGFGDPNLPDGPERYIAVYRHVVDIFRQEGAANVIWVWAVNETSVPQQDWNDPMNYYPGDQYVDWLAIDGYNWGDANKAVGWRSFQDIFGPTYDKLTTAVPNKPVMIGEFASGEEGGNKAAWIAESFAQMQKMPRMKAFIWFNLYKEAAWIVDSSDESLAAFQKAMKDKAFLEKFPGI